MLAYTLARKEAKKPGKTLRVVQAGSLADTLVERLAEVKAKRVGETLTDVMADSLLQTLTARLADMRILKT